ncbi:MAG TPA: hypothetical protein VMA36_09180 [Candidatus Limnocylindria bacterium]|jgi:hypothetical protein|nr:hypothetical protein [Candidatus Limnocylindria bacterium]
MRRYVSSALTVAVFVFPLAASAATYEMRSVDHTLRGVILSVDGKYGLTVRDARTAVESVTLHQGTVITPTGLRLKPGMQVTIAGHLDGATFAANEVVAPAGYLEAQERENRAGENAAAPSAPNGTFQTNGPSAEGGG